MRTLIFVLIILLSVFLFYRYAGYSVQKRFPLTQNIFEGSKSSSTVRENVPKVTVVAEGLRVPWAIAFLPDGGMLITERSGFVRLVNSWGKLENEPVGEIDVKQTSEGGLHGITIHPDFAINSYIYLYYTYAENGGETLNRVSRYTYKDNKLSGEMFMVDKIPGAANHDGGRIKFGPDGLLYVTTGDAQNPSNAQDKNSLAGKILRVDEDGNPAPGNPFENRIYSFGHRNPQGITWDQNGNLWSTEHGPSGSETGNDELNKIEMGKNYGWPEIRGNQKKEGMVIPIAESGRGKTWAPAGVAYYAEQLFFAGLRGQALYRVKNFDSKVEIEELFEGEFGRLREVVLGPDGMIYVATSNWDGRGVPKSGDDRILRINPDKL